MVFHVGPHGWVYTELMKNADVIGTRYSESNSPSSWGFFSSGTVVVGVSHVDHVYVRLGRTSNGRVASIHESRTTFSGWLLAISLENKNVVLNCNMIFFLYISSKRQI